MRTLPRGALVAALILPFCWAARAGETGALDALERQFLELPPDVRRLTGPLFWLHGDESRERLEEYVAKVAEGGNGCFTAESRPHQDWLGEGWYRDLAVCLEAARRHDLFMWIFDEKWWPSGEVGGEVPERYGSKLLVAETADVSGPTLFTASGYAGPRFIGAIAARVVEGVLDGATLVDLAPSIQDGALRFDAPPGAWRVLKFTWTNVPGDRLLVDGASQDCVDWYIRTVYQPHYDRFSADFGKTIRGFFYDEPETHGDFGSEVLAVLAERGVDWKMALAAWTATLAGEEQAAARYQYQDALAEAWGRTLYGGLTRWCHEHGVLSIGHFLEHDWEYLHPRLCAGNMFQLQKHSDMGAIDAVFRQFAPGTRDAGLWQTPKLGSSISHAYGKADDVAMVEIFGARGQDVGYPEMKWWADRMFACGVNFMIPHSFNPRAPYDDDCPPYFYNGGFEPRWPLYRVFADYCCRLSLMLTGGRHVCPVAFLFLGGSRHVGASIPPEDLTTALQDALYDCDWIPYEVFERDTEISGPELLLRQESCRVLVVPPVEVIPHATLARAKEFFEEGGVVLGYGFLPAKSATIGRSGAEIAALREAIWGEAAAPGFKVCKTSAAGGRSYLLPEKPTAEEVRAVLADGAGIRPGLEVVEGGTDGWVHALHRVKASRDVFFVTNQDHEGAARELRLRAHAAGVPECWDAMRGEIRAVPYERSGEDVELNLTLEPSESVLLVFSPEERALPPRAQAEPGAVLATLPIVRLSVPPEPAPRLEELAGLRMFEDCPWVWHPEGDPAASAPPGQRFFRARLDLPADRTPLKAVFLGTADNDFTLFVNGEQAGKGDGSDLGWRNPVEIDVMQLLVPGGNQFAIAARNAGRDPNPAGLMGLLVVEFDAGEALVARVDGAWRACDEEQGGWTGLEFDDAAWPQAREIARFGAGPWGCLGADRLTLSPCVADPFTGSVEIPADRLAGARVDLEMNGLAPEAAARVTVNGCYAGGFIGAPFRLDVTPHLVAGQNTVRIEPFAPHAAWLVFRAR
ncbi:MAG: hypothetical protein HY812_07310 [Planctomycetes bacterium]|nr:hypothetical protein [Planctomycetota bacterium]